MGHRTGWLALGAGIAGGADVILIPEMPFNIKSVAAAIRQRSREGKQFSIIALSEGAMSVEDVKAMKVVDEQKKGGTKKGKSTSDEELAKLEMRLANRTLSLSKRLEQLTGLESRVTILGHLQRGGTPSAADRVLATKLGTACARLIDDGVSGVMVAAKGESTEPVPLEDVAGKRKLVPLDHPWILAARDVGTCLGE
jgi:6-phosphofructokinase 1